jgi:hypothetical protein
MWNDLRLAARVLSCRPLLAAVVVSCLAIGLALNTGLFTVVDGLLYRPLQFPDPGRLYVPTLHVESAGRVIASGVLSPVSFRAIASPAGALAGSGAFAPEDFDGDGAHAAAGGIRHATQITHQLASVLGVAPVLGRAFEAADERPVERPAALLGHDLWVARFSADPGVIGRSLDIGRCRFRIVGVMPPGFDFPRGRISGHRSALATIARISAS